MENRKRHTKRLFTGLSAAMFLTQTICSVFTLAEQLTFDGTTQLDTDSCYLDVDSVSLQLEIEEIYIQEGSQISQGDQILKLTEDSYKEALDDYAAAIIRADNQLTDVQLEYDQGILEAGYTYETAKTKAEQAEFVKEYQEKELADTIENYAEALENLEDRIAELESGISAGSYTSGSGGSGGNGSSSGSGGGSFGDQKDEEKESETEPGSDGMGSKPGETETETSGAQPGETETEAPGAQPGETETEAPGAQPGGTETETPSVSGNYKEIEEKIVELKSLLDENMEEYQALLGRLEELGLNLSDSSNAAGQAESSQDTVSTDVSGAQLGDSIQGNTNVKTNLENVQKNLEQVPEGLLDAVKSVNEEYYNKYDEYKKLLESLIRQLDADIRTQQEVQSVLENEPETENSSLDETALQEVIAGLKASAAQRSEIYNQLILLQEEWISGLQKDLEESSKPGETEQQPGETEQKPGETEQKPGETEQKPDETEQKPGGAEQQPGGAEQQPGETEQKPGETEQKPDETEQKPGETVQQSGETEQQPGETKQQNGNGTFPQNGENTGSLPSGGFSMSSGGSSSAAPSTASGGAASGGTMSAPDSTVSGSSGMQMSGNGSVSESDVSLFGNKYDLTQVNSLLEREPSGTEDAQDLLEQLEETRDTAEEQYSELIRERKITELGIQYTYDTSVIAGKLVEFTYQEELQEWEETLAQAKDEKETLEEDKAILDSMSNGILTSDRDGTVAEISYETGDIISSQEPVISFYHTDTVTVTIQVPQETITEFAVGDPVTVTVNSRMKREGTVAEKASEPVDGTSRTVVQYEVTISMDNSDGMLSSGLAATVSLQDTKTADQESENEEE